MLDEKADLQTVLAAWHGATVRLEQTHESLRREVQELTKELEEKNRQLARKNRLAGLGQMASHVAHEVRNNLVPVTLYLSLLRRRIAGDPGSLDMLDKIAAGFTALDAMVNDLLHFTSDRDPRWQVFPLRKLIEEICSSLAPQWSAQAIRTTSRRGREINVAADRDMIRRAVLNAALNAMDAMPRRRQSDFSARCVPARRGTRNRRQRPGPPTRSFPASSSRSLRRSKRARGWDWPSWPRIAEVHGGEFTAANSPEGPPSSRSASPPPSGRPPMMVSAHEDNPSPLAGRPRAGRRRSPPSPRVDGRRLRQAGHRVACCSSASETLQVIQQESYDCIVTDLKMPGMSGVEFIIQFQQRPGAQVVMVTAHATVTRRSKRCGTGHSTTSKSLSTWIKSNGWLRRRTITSASSSAIKRAASPIAWAPDEHAVTTALL